MDIIDERHQYYRPYNTGASMLPADPILVQPYSPTEGHFSMTGDGNYPSMDIQVRAGQLRGKIETEQDEAELISQKYKIEIQRVIHKIKSAGSKYNEKELNHETLSKENSLLLERFREAERILSIEKQRCLGMQTGVSSEKSALKNQKLNVNLKIKTMMERNIKNQERELDNLNQIMSRKMEQLQGVLKSKLHQKRTFREKLGDLKEDVSKFKLSKQALWDKISQSGYTAFPTNDKLVRLEELISSSEASLKAETKRRKYLQEQLNSVTIKSLQKEQRYEKEIYQFQNRIKELHNSMTQHNIQIEELLIKNRLHECKINQSDMIADMSRKYVNCLHEQGSINQEMERLKQDENAQVQRLQQQLIDRRVRDVEKAIKTQQTNNTILKNQYEKLVSKVEAVARQTIQDVIFHH